MGSMESPLQAKGRLMECLGCSLKGSQHSFFCGLLLAGPCKAAPFLSIQVISPLEM